MDLFSTTKQERPLVKHQGVFKPTATVTEAVFLITGMTIGAGILGLPYVIAQVGVVIGVAEIIFLGIIILFLNRMIGSAVARTGEPMQLPGLAGTYLGPVAKILMSGTILFGMYGALLAYMVGEGNTLSALFGGSPIGWSIIFWSVGSIIIWRGMATVKFFEKIIGSAVLIIIGIIILVAFPHIQIANISYSHFGKFFVPFGVILFALHASPAIAEAHALLRGDVAKFRRAVTIGTLIPIVTYILFATAVVGVTGRGTALIATLGLSSNFGSFVGLLGNIFAALAMGTGFVGLGTAFRDTLRWDYKVPVLVAAILVSCVPLALLLAGITNFISILSVVGSLFIGVEAVLVCLIYAKIRHKSLISAQSMGITHPFVAELSVLLAFTGITVFSILKLFY